MQLEDVTIAVQESLRLDDEPTQLRHEVDNSNQVSNRRRYQPCVSCVWYCAPCGHPPRAGRKLTTRVASVWHFSWHWCFKWWSQAKHRPTLWRTGSHRCIFHIFSRAVRLKVRLSCFCAFCSLAIEPMFLTCHCDLSHLFFCATLWSYLFQTRHASHQGNYTAVVYFGCTGWY